MSFVSWSFVALFLVVFALYWRLGRVAQNLLLVGAGAVFYGWIHPWFLLLLFGSATLDYAATRGIERFPAWRNASLGASLLGNLGLLATFKYLDFFLANVAAVAEAMGLPLTTPVIGLLLPAGISFYTFQTLSYTVDVWRGHARARRSYLDVLVYVSFFPQLVAGPIERVSTLMPQVEQRRTWSTDQVTSGLGLALWGAVQKVCLADTIAPHVDRVFALQDPAPVMVWAATLGFMVQILADFSGYTDIARGTARMLGFELSRNFLTPYLATGPRDFWRRWHVTLSTWFRDYVYVPLGGSRQGHARAVVATMTSMLLSGLWHGAAWHFVVWGAYHAVMVTLDRELAPLRRRLLPSDRVRRVAGVALMWPVTLVGWLLFREPSVARSLALIAAPPWQGSEAAWAVARFLVAMTGVVGAPLMLAGVWSAWVAPRLRDHPGRFVVRSGLWGVALLALGWFGAEAPQAFLYFRF